MNAILSRVESVRDGHRLKRFDLGKRPSCIVLTPRFRTSRHIVALLIPTGAGEPKLVVKMPRLAGDDDGIAREARVLTALREKSPSASESIPEVVTCEDGDRPLLVETALVGPLMTRRMLRADPVRCVDTVVSWLISLPASHHGGTSFERLFVEPLSLFAEFFPEAATERDLVSRTLEIVEPLRGASLPRVFEHGDLSHPNLILLPSGRIGVVDWELAEEDGFPLHDLSFFLAFATFALRRTPTPEDYVAAFGDTFFGRAGWARSRVLAYAEGLELDPALLAPLFLACWARYTAGLAVRVADDRSGLNEEARRLGAPEPLLPTLEPHPREPGRSGVGSMTRAGFTVALIGPDGAGKTTIARALDSELPFPVAYLYMGVNPDSSNHLLFTTRVVHALRRRRGGRPDTVGPRDSRESEAIAPRGFARRNLRSARSFVRLGNRLAEEWHRAILATLHRRRGDVVIFDRHFFADYFAYDIAAKPRRTASRRLHGFVLSRLYPKPDLVIYLDAPAEVLFERKGEGTVESLERRRREYLELGKVLDGFTVVDASRPVEAVTRDVVARIEAYSRRRGFATQERVRS